MIVKEYIEKEGRSQIKDVPPDRTGDLLGFIKSIQLWGSRRQEFIEIPEFYSVDVSRVYSHNDGKPFCALVSIKVWPLEEANKGLLRELDIQITILFRKMKGVGIARPSFVAYCMYWDYLWSKEVMESFDNNRLGWAGASLVLHRLDSTSRLAAMYDRYDDFGPVRKWSNGIVTSYMDRKILRPELIRRGLIQDRRK